MALSEKTIAEMKAGMKQVASHEGHDVDPAYMDAMIRTGIRAKWLKDMEKAGKLKIELVPRRITSDKTSAAAYYVVRIGTETFDDPNACLAGAWPSEVLVAHVALALGAGVGGNS